MSTTTLVLRSEWTKLTTLVSQWSAPLVSVVLSVGITLLVNVNYSDDGSLTEDKGVGIFYGFNFGQVPLACLGILLIGQEFNSGTIRASLTAVPRRGRLYAAKALLGAGLGLLVGLLTTGGSMLAVAATTGLDLSAPGMLRTAVAGVLYCPMLVLICFGITACFRNLSAALGLLTPLVFFGTTALAAIPGVRVAAQYLPDRAGQYAWKQQPDPHIAFGHWTGLLLMAAWTVLLLWLGHRSLTRKDV
ncbi:ABC transporter permease subunit [Kitasatospora sp. NPDC004289]